jgi:S1-C subfamily serine protease
VLTAAHAVATPGVREVHYFTQESYPERAKVFTRVTTVATWPAADVALLSVAVGDWPAPVLKLAGPGQRPKTFPTTALSVGCTAAGSPTAREEQIQAKRLVRRPEGAVAFFWQCQAASLPGRSGGPLLDRNGRVIGLAAATQSGRGFYAHLDEILAALKKHDYSWLWENK